MPKKSTELAFKEPLVAEISGTLCYGDSHILVLGCETSEVIILKEKWVITYQSSNIIVRGAIVEGSWKCTGLHFASIEMRRPHEPSGSDLRLKALFYKCIDGAVPFITLNLPCGIPHNWFAVSSVHILRVVVINSPMHSRLLASWSSYLVERPFQKALVPGWSNLGPGCTNCICQLEVFISGMDVLVALCCEQMYGNSPFLNDHVHVGQCK